MFCARPIRCATPISGDFLQSPAQTSGASPTPTECAPGSPSGPGGLPEPTAGCRGTATSRRGPRLDDLQPATQLPLSHFDRQLRYPLTAVEAMAHRYQRANHRPTPESPHRIVGSGSIEAEPATSVQHFQCRSGFDFSTASFGTTYCERRSALPRFGHGYASPFILVRQ
jgi:hypothetical protein